MLIIGINSNQTIQNNRLNVRNSMILFVFGTTIASDISYTIYEVKSFQEYNISLYITSTLVCNLLCLTNFIWNMPNLFHFFNSIEDTVNKRGWSPEHSKVKLSLSGNNYQIRELVGTQTLQKIMLIYLFHFWFFNLHAQSINKLYWHFMAMWIEHVAYQASSIKLSKISFQSLVLIQYKNNYLAFKTV